MKKFENILIASDIDGTLLWEAEFIHPRNFEKLRYFCENGGHFALSTGRNHKDIFRIIGDLQDYVNMPCILCNGSYLYDCVSETILNPQFLDRERSYQLFRDTQEKFPTVGFRASFPEGFLVPDNDTIIMAELRDRYHLDSFATLCPLADFPKHSLFKAAFLSNDKKALSELYHYIEQNYTDIFTLTTSGETIIEIQPLGISKRFQFPYLKSLYGGAALWCIGDFNNDIEMLLGADVAVCPANAVDEVKAICEIEVCHCRDGALAEMIDEIEKRIDSAKA